MASTTARTFTQRRRTAIHRHAWEEATLRSLVPQLAMQVATSGSWWPQQPRQALYLSWCSRVLYQICRPRIRLCIQAMLQNVMQQLAGSDSDDD